MTATEIEGRLATVEQVLADPPNVHFADPVYGLVPPGGVWRTRRSCYEFLAAQCGAGSRTLETGLGISTALFTMWGCVHTCVVPWRIEADRLRGYLAERQVDDGPLRVEVGYSHEVLPALEPTPLDLVLIDGGHGFPMAMLDWFYAGGRLVTGGVLVLDDLHLPSVTAGLVDFLDRDPRWVELHRTDKWAAWRRESAGTLAEEWTDQPFFSPYRPRA
ncbi:class I SAM-dependent methyltransferase [Jidongwangia harbinensis]|uniref:class I SAM-dependent methyltransferase n=1 Tax=Jidongwangia harbinensis TaxID=2878561 RepID=UPI001CD9ACE2|nr:class I SAM-dependent methyltransferase [Jidongwangia harbinensis]MCA2211355.1 class I SAM-dependent methyltransferase [Jidongwangia harbinensis]